jgi:hypothetical protein
MLRNMAGQACSYQCKESQEAAFAWHILGTHIGKELRMAELQELRQHEVQILTTQTRIELAGEYAWRCPMEGCYIAMRADTVRRHVSTRHLDAERQAYQRGDDLKARAVDIVNHILDA